MNIEFTKNEDFKGSIHFEAPSFTAGYTLCGLTLDMDQATCGDYKMTNKKVNCKHCKEIVKHCKTLKI